MSADRGGGATASASAFSTQTSPACIKILCSYGGRILPRPKDGTLRYVGGETHLLSLPLPSCPADLISHLARLPFSAMIPDSRVVLKYQLPGDESMDPLITVSNIQDFHIMMEFVVVSPFSKLRLFLFPSCGQWGGDIHDFDLDPITTVLYIKAVNDQGAGPLFLREGLRSNTSPPSDFTASNEDVSKQGLSPPIVDFKPRPPIDLPSSPRHLDKSFMSNQEAPGISQLGSGTGVVGELPPAMPPWPMTVFIEPLHSFVADMPGSFEAKVPETKDGDDAGKGKAAYKPLSELPPLPASLLDAHHREDCSLCQKVLPHAHSDPAGVVSMRESPAAFGSLQLDDVARLVDRQIDSEVRETLHELISPASPVRSNCLSADPVMPLQEVILPPPLPTSLVMPLKIAEVEKNSADGTCIVSSMSSSSSPVMNETVVCDYAIPLRDVIPVPPPPLPTTLSLPHAVVDADKVNRGEPIMMANVMPNVLLDDPINLDGEDILVSPPSSKNSSESHCSVTLEKPLKTNDGPTGNQSIQIDALFSQDNVQTVSQSHVKSTEILSVALIVNQTEMPASSALKNLDLVGDSDCDPKSEPLQLDQRTSLKELIREKTAISESEHNLRTPAQLIPPGSSTGDPEIFNGMQICVEKERESVSSPTSTATYDGSSSPASDPKSPVDVAHHLDLDIVTVPPVTSGQSCTGISSHSNDLEQHQQDLLDIRKGEQSMLPTPKKLVRGKAFIPKGTSSDKSVVPSEPERVESSVQGECNQLEILDKELSVDPNSDIIGDDNMKQDLLSPDQDPLSLILSSQPKDQNFVSFEDKNSAATSGEGRVGENILGAENCDSENVNITPGEWISARLKEGQDAGKLQIIKNSDLEELRELGSGSFGTVFHGKWKGSDVAIKRINDRYFIGKQSEREKMWADFLNEAIKLAEMHHPNVLAFYGIVLDGPGGSIATVAEFMSNGSLRHVLQSNDKTLNWRKRVLIAIDAACAMEYLHSKNVVHFDLKSDNLLVNLKDPQRPICKVGDLGLAKARSRTLVSASLRGTIPWMAPELLNGTNSMVTDKVDVFSYGIVLWELLTGELPYVDLHYGSILGGLINNTLRPEVPESCNLEWRSLMEQCWAHEPSERPSFSEIVGRLRSMAESPKKGQA